MKLPSFGGIKPIDPVHDPELSTIAVDPIFPKSVAMISIRADPMLRPLAFEFIRMVAPRWSPEAVARKVTAAGPPTMSKD